MTMETDGNIWYMPYPFECQPIYIYSELLAPRKRGVGAKSLEVPETIHEHPNEKWADDSVHRYYRIPTLAIHANPSITMHCEVHRDNLLQRPTPLSVSRWVSADYFIWEMSAKLAGSLTDPAWTQCFKEYYRVEWQRIKENFQNIGDLPSRFVQEVPTPPYLLADVSIRTDEGSFYFPLCAQSGREMIHSPFWALWLFLLRQETQSVGTLKVLLRFPCRSHPRKSLASLP